MKGFIAFIVLIILPIVFWVEGPGYNMAKNGYIWIAFLYAPVSAAIFAYLVSGKKDGKIVGDPKALAVKDDQDNWLISRFWGVFILLTVVQVIFAFILKAQI